MIKEKLFDVIAKRRCTLLGVGPMSKNCVDAAIEVANEGDVPIFLIASRRQIECRELGGGYVENWSTEDFSSYVRQRDKRGMVLLSRDHGGPWQNENEKKRNLSLPNAMAASKKSFKADINSGFQVIHIDPSVDIHATPSVDEVLDRVVELYEFCWGEASRSQRDIIFEVGTEEQTGSTNSQEELAYTLEKLNLFCASYNLPKPTFVVIQGGTRVMETRNVGSFGLPVRVENEIPPEIQIPKMIEVCKKFGVLMKAHNTDYLSDESLSWYPKLGIHAANIAPEFGVVETNSFISVLENNGLQKLSDDFCELAFNSEKWSKWMVPGGSVSDRDKAIISGHYVFGSDVFKEIKSKASLELEKKDLNLDAHLKSSIKKCIKRYTHNFKLER